MWVSLSIVFSLLWKCMTCQEAPGYSILVNSTFSVQEGLCVTIPCNFTAAARSVFTNSRGFWLQSPLTPYKFVATNVKSRSVLKENFHLTGNTDNGDCTLSITEARGEDTGTYFFRFQDSKDKLSGYNFVNSMVTVYVTELSDKPEISPLRRIVAGQEVTLNCTSPGRCSGKSPLITWEGKAEKSGETKTFMERNEDGTITYWASLTFLPWIQDDQSLLTCKVTFDSNVTTSSSIALNVVGCPGQMISCPVCRSMHPPLIIGMVVGNIVILTLIIVGSLCVLKKHTKKKQSDNRERLPNSDQRGQGTDSTYQDLRGQKNDIYYNIRKL